MRRVEIHGDVGRLAAVVRVPHGLEAGARRPCLVMCAGMSLTKEVWLVPHAERFAAAGFVTLSFDYSTFGESEGAPRCRLNLPQQVRDVRAVLDFAAGLPEVDPERLGLFGVSLGASIAVAAAGHDPRVRAVVAVAGPMDLTRVWSALPGFEGFRAKVDAARRRFAVTGEASTIPLHKLVAADPETVARIEADTARFPGWRPELSFESLRDLFEFRPEQVAHAIRPGAALFVAPGADELIGAQELPSAAARAPGARLEVLPGARHVQVYEEGPVFERLLELSLEHYRARLAAAPGSQA